MNVTPDSSVTTVMYANLSTFVSQTEHIFELQYSNINYEGMLFGIKYPAGILTAPYTGGTTVYIQFIGSLANYYFERDTLFK